MRESIKVSTDDYNFKFRVAGIIIKNDKILLVNMDKADFWCLPGGYVELGEKTDIALAREILEEARKEVIIKKYLGVDENFFINKYSKKMHEICFYYLAEFVDKNIDDKDFSLIENDKGNIVNLDFKWISLQNLCKINIKPSFLKELLASQELEFNHLFTNEIEK